MNRLDTVSGLFLDRTERFPDDLIYTYKKEGIWVDVTWREYEEVARETANGLLSMGMKIGDRVACLSENRWEWYYFAMGAVMARGVVVGIYATNPSNECEHVLNHSEARFMLAEDQEQIDKILPLLEQLQYLEKIIVIGKYEQRDHPKLMSLEEFHERGREFGRKNPKLYKKTAKDATKDEAITFVYTSGTTGPPKGAIITHENVIGLAEISLKHYGLELGDTCLEFLPLAHIGGQVVGHYFRLYSRIPAIIAEGWYDALYNAWEVEPTTFVSTPRMYEKLYNSIQSRVDDATTIQRRVNELAMSIGGRYVKLKESKETISWRLKIAYALSDFMVFRKFRDILGGKMKYATSGGAPLSAKVVEFFHIIGMPILEAFGMTETTAWISINSFERHKIGSVGMPIPGIDIKIAEDGEILTKGPGNCAGYFKDEEATRKLIDEDEWLHSGDVGMLDEDGFLIITDRMKDIFITAGGKNVAPGNIENLMKTSKYISQCMVYGDKKKYLVALFTLDEEEITKHARDNRIIFKDTKELTQKQEIHKLIKKEVAEKNKELASVETIKNFFILRDELDEDRSEVTATMKVKRKVLSEKYREQMEALYH